MDSSEPGAAAPHDLMRFERSKRRSGATVLSALVLSALAATTCTEATFGPGSMLTEGTWGGQDAGLVLSDTLAHVHFGCTFGDFPAPIELDESGRFSISGEYVLRAYPIVVGPPMPAELAGVVRGVDLTMTVAVHDTIDDRLVVMGPATVRLGREPEMQICPICESPDRARVPPAP